MCVQIVPFSPLKELESILVYLIIVQDGKFPKINKRARWNKAMKVGIFKNHYYERYVIWTIF